MNFKSSKIECNSVEQILFQSTFNELNEKEKSDILQHIKTCETCKSSEKLLNIFKQSLHHELVESQLNPNPEIKESIIKKLKSEQERQNLFVDFVRNFFEVKVPLYQVITVLILIGVFAFFLNNKSHTLESFKNNVSIIAAIDSNKISMNFQNSLELIDSYNKGKSIIEDSVLSSFIQSSM
jgi:hypothetical protein